MAIDKNDLDKLIDTSGVSKATAKKLRDANEEQAQASSKSSPRGHGAPSANTTPVASF